MDSFLGRFVDDVLRESEEDVQARPGFEAEGDRLGGYELISILGEGTFGTVWRARQMEPVKREVALKILKPGVDTREVMARFDQERQALARMEHPGIAKVFDAGATASGRPYFVMELARGEAVTTFCEARDLSVEERLGLFVDVARAIQHAHQKGVIHRDLKPANILVGDGDLGPEPKVIDFGIAKAVEQEPLTEMTLLQTRMDQVLGTPAYMSPEQARPGTVDIDTRTDVYSLGVILYEMLTGEPPFSMRELMEAGREGMLKVIEERVPERPSTRIRTKAATVDEAETVPARVWGPKEMRGDLDWIVMRCLEKEPSRRYESAGALAQDVGRYLRQEPVEARPPSGLYVARQFVRRNRMAVLAAGVLLVTLVAGVATSTWMYLREREARARLVVEVEKSQQVARFLSETLAAAGPSKARGRDATMLKDILENTAIRVGEELSGQPEVEAELRWVIGGTLRDIDDYSKAVEQLEVAAKLAREEWGEESPLLSKVLIDYGAALEANGQVRQAEEPMRQALHLMERQGEKGSEAWAEALSTLGWIYIKSGRSKEALPIARESVKAISEFPESPHLARCFNVLATALRNTGSLEESLPFYREAMEVDLRLKGENHPDVVSALDNYGYALEMARKDDEAESVLKRCLELGRVVP